MVKLVNSNETKSSETKDSDYTATYWSDSYFDVPGLQVYNSTYISMSQPTILIRTCYQLGINEMYKCIVVEEFDTLELTPELWVL